jgi:hypothetical protein
MGCGWAGLGIAWDGHGLGIGLLWSWARNGLVWAWTGFEMGLADYGLVWA